MKIKKIELTTFYRCFEYCKEVLFCFAVFRAVEKEMIYHLMLLPQIQMGFIGFVKPCLNLFSLK